MSVRNSINTEDIVEEESVQEEKRKESVKQKVYLETLFATELGRWGRYQWQTLALVVVAVTVGGLTPSEHVFSASRIPTRCLIPECEHPGSEIEFAPQWILNAVPGTSVNTFDNCQRFANTSHAVDVEDDTCPVELFDQNTRVDCDQYVYENTNSVVYDFDLACDEWSRTLIGSVRTFGNLVAMPITGFVSDRWGRRIALTLNAFNTAWMGVVRYWASTYVGFVISVFFEAALGNGMLACAYVLLVEIMDSKYRAVTSATSNSSFAMGQVIMGLIAWGLPNWRHFTLALYIPQLLTISYLWLAPESIRWYMSRGYFEKSEAALKHVARLNKKQLSDKSLLALRQTAQEDAERALKDKEGEPWLIVLVFRNKPILLRCLVTPVWWITFTFIYYGLSINAVNISGNPYLNYIVVAAIEIPGFYTSAALIDRVGRRPMLMGAFLICAACQFGYIFLPKDMYAVSLTVYLIGKLFIATVATTLYIYTVELYPTKYRLSFFTYSSMVGRVGAIVAPLTPAIGDAVWEYFPFVLFGGLAVFSSLLVFLTPETFGVKLPDTMDEAADIGRKQDTKNNK